MGGAASHYWATLI